MRTDTKYEGKEILAAVLRDVKCHLIHTITEIRFALKEGFGCTFIIRDFLKKGVSASVIVRGTQTERVKCDGIFWDCLPREICDNLIACKYW